MLVSMNRYDTESSRWEAVRTRDRAAGGAFVFAVRTTGVYCRPGCAARRPRRENVAFFTDGQAARRAGFRACLRCLPDDPSDDVRARAVVAAACRRIEAAEQPPSLAELAREAGLSAHHFHRVFARTAGLTPKQYADAARLRRFRDGLAGQRTSVTAAMYDAGFGSKARGYAAAGALGMTPRAVRGGGAGERIAYAVGSTSLGAVAIAATERGVCAIELGDAGADVLAALTRRFPRAVLYEDAEALESVLAAVTAYAERVTPALELPLDVRGTAFQQRVWRALGQVAPGTTVSYGELARRIGRPAATRAVASACGANPVALAVPCHRAVRGDGGLGGYRWGLERKRALLASERRSGD